MPMPKIIMIASSMDGLHFSRTGTSLVARINSRACAAAHQYRSHINDELNPQNRSALPPAWAARASHSPGVAAFPSADVERDQHHVDRKDDAEHDDQNQAELPKHFIGGVGIGGNEIPFAPLI